MTILVTVPQQTYTPQTLPFPLVGLTLKLASVTLSVVGPNSVTAIEKLF